MLLIAYQAKLLTLAIISLHIRSMWETICDAWACWSGWNFGPNSTEYPYSEIEYPPPKMKIVRESQMKIVRESKSEYRIPPQNENCQRVQIREFQNTPQWKLSESPNLFRVSEYPPKMKIVRESKSKSTEYPPKMKIVRESKSESFRIPPLKMKIVRESKSEYRIPPQNENCQRVQIREFQNTPPPPQKI